MDSLEKLLPSDLPSFIWGLVAAGIGLILTGFLKEAGKDFWAYLKARINPPPKPEPDPVRVDIKYRPKIYAEGDCLWVRDENLFRKESEGYTYYRLPENGAKVVRGYDREASFLMVKPHAKPLENS